jgi:hypothetical protein
VIVAFSGWRGWTDDLFIRQRIDEQWGHQLLFGPRDQDLTFRVGDAKGADAIIVAHLLEAKVQPVIYTANWEAEGKWAGPIRNRRMLLGLDSHDPHPMQPADLLVAFPEPGTAKPIRGAGTWNAIEQAHWRGIEVRIPGYRVPLIDRAEVAAYYQLTIGAKQ